jgi:predicted Rdx family selenoprotein
VAELSGTAHEAEMQPGRKSQFDVLVDERLVFSKEREKRFPELADILAELA